MFVPLADLTFVLETKDPNLLQEIHLAEQNYRACAQALQIRNQELQNFTRIHMCLMTFAILKQEQASLQQAIAILFSSGRQRTACISL
jgi:hypothetical protein